MRALSFKIINLILIAFFFLGGFSVANAQTQDPQYVWFFKYKVNNAQTTPFQFQSFPGGVPNSVASAEGKKQCEAAQKVAPKYGPITNCAMTIQAAVTQFQEVEQARLQSLAEAAESRAATAMIDRLHCGFPVTDFSDNKIQDCIPVITYYLVYKPAAAILIGAGMVFDVMLTLSIDSSFVQQDFVEEVWTLIRDFSNMLFIFILIYTGIQTVLGMGNWRKTVLMVITMALLINFSLFFTKVVIDAGNILAVEVYNAMGSPKSADESSFQAQGAVAERDISASIAGAFGPQRFLAVTDKTTATDATIVFLIASVVSAFAAYVFFWAALLFIGRLLAFWFLMAVSPFAFISVAFPNGSKFSDWLKLLLSQSFVAPVFLFMVYFIMKVISSGNGILDGMLKEPSEKSAFAFDKVLIPVVVATMIIVALKKALDMTKSMSGDFGKFGTSLITTPLGLAKDAGLAVATGGASLAGAAGRKYIGGAAARELERGVDSSGNALTDARRATLEARTRSSFDVRNIGLDKSSTFGKVMSGKAFQKDFGAGGVEKATKDAQKSTIDNIPQMNVFEEQGARSRAAKTAETHEAELESTQKMITEKTTIVKTASDKLEAAEKEERTFMMNNGAGTSLDPKLALKLAEAKKEKAEAEAALARATEQEVRIKATQKEAGADVVIKKENDRRKEEYADKVEKEGDHTSAAKIRKGEESGHAKKLKETAKAVKEAKEKGESTEVLEFLERKHTEAKNA